MKFLESETLDSTIASFFCENAYAFNHTDSPSFTAMGFCLANFIFSSIMTAKLEEAAVLKAFPFS